jgi:predicted nucleic acid-binding Zn ribbon protein
MPRKPQRSGAPPTCPVCGAEVPPGARACPDCGADERTGWDEAKTRYDDLDLPDEAFDCDQELKDQRLKARPRFRGLPVFWWLVGIGVLLLIVSVVVLGRF